MLFRSLPLDGFLAEGPSPLRLEMPADWPAIAPDAVSLADERFLAVALRAGCAVARYGRAEALEAYAELHAAALGALRRAAGLENVVTS